MGTSAKRLQVSLKDMQCVVRLFLFGPSHIREAWIKYQISRVGVLERNGLRERERVGDRGVLVLSLWFSVTSLALSFFLRLLPSSLFPRLKQGSESEFFLGASMSLNHPRVHRSAGLRDAVTLPWNNVSIQSKNSVETEKSPKSNYCAYY